jgi:hypothetical protein
MTARLRFWIGSDGWTCRRDCMSKKPRKHRDSHGIPKQTVVANQTIPVPGTIHTGASVLAAHTVGRNPPINAKFVFLLLVDFIKLRCTRKRHGKGFKLFCKDFRVRQVRLIRAIGPITWRRMGKIVNAIQSEIDTW